MLCSLSFPTIRLTWSFSELRFPSHYCYFNCSIDRMCASIQFLRVSYQSDKPRIDPHLWSSTPIRLSFQCSVLSVQEIGKSPNLRVCPTINDP